MMRTVLGGYGGTTNLTQRAISLNVIGYNNLITKWTKEIVLLEIFGENYEIVKGLKYKIDASSDRLDWQNRKFIPPSDLGWYYITTNDEASLRCYLLEVNQELSLTIYLLTKNDWQT